LINFEQFFNFVVNAKKNENCKTQVYLIVTVHKSWKRVGLLVHYAVS